MYNSGLSRPTWGVEDIYPGMFRDATPANTQQFSGPTPTGGPKSGHILLGILVLLVAIRIAYEVAE
jgi:hypothetical protein